MQDRKPNVPHQGKAGPVTTAKPRKENSNANNEPRASRVEHGKADFKNGTAGRKTWPNLPK